MSRNNQLFFQAMQRSLFFIATLRFISLHLGLASNSPFDYCSFAGDELSHNRAIPTRIGSSKYTIHQVQTLVRHGSRTPANDSANSCFPKMRENPIEWNCQYLEEFSGIRGFEEEALTYSMNQKFDVNPFENELKGTCRKGQLMLGALDQIEALAFAIYRAYFANDVKLFGIDELNADPDILYLRSTDIQRTRHTNAALSTYIVLFLESIKGKKLANKLVLHLMDESHDDMKGDFDQCEDINAIMYSLSITNEYKNLTKKHMHIYEYLKKQLGVVYLDNMWYWNVLDCYLSLLCNYKQDYIPDELLIYEDDSSHESLGYQLYNAIEEENAYFALSSDSILSKCISQQFVKDFFQNFDVPQNKDIPNKGPKKAKLIINTAHDSTFIYFLSSIPNLFDGKWPSYASMINFEIYKDDQEHAYFRIIYNGHDITDRIKGCKDSKTFTEENLCPYYYLENAVAWAYKFSVPEDLKSGPDKTIAPAPHNSNSESILSSHGFLLNATPSVVVRAVLFILLGFFLGIITSISVRYINTTMKRTRYQAMAEVNSPHMD